MRIATGLEDDHEFNKLQSHEHLNKAASYPTGLEDNYEQMRKFSTDRTFTAGTTVKSRRTKETGKVMAGNMRGKIAVEFPSSIRLCEPGELEGVE